MAKLTSFTFITLNGFFKGLNEDTSWHRHGKEEAKFSEKQLAKGNVLLFGRKTFEMMRYFWPSEMAAEMFPKVAAGMNAADKIVFSNTLTSAGWQHTRIMSGDIIKKVKALKKNSSKNMTILGSGSIVSAFSDAKLIDEYEIMIDPLAIGKGTSFLSGIKKQLDLQFVDVQRFKKSGIVLLRYRKS